VPTESARPTPTCGENVDDASRAIYESERCREPFARAVPRRVAKTTRRFAVVLHLGSPRAFAIDKLGQIRWPRLCRPLEHL